LAIRARNLASENPSTVFPPFQVSLKRFNEQHQNILQTILQHPKSVASQVEISSNLSIPVIFGKVLSAIDPLRYSTSTTDGIFST
jgi:hypothetical protein